MQKKRKIPRGFIVMMGGLFIVTVLVPVVYFLMGYDAAWLVAYPILALWFLGVLLWIVFFDSKKRWPGVPWMIRMGRVMFKYRDEKS